MTEQEFKDKVIFTANGHFRMANQYVITASSINTEPPIIRQTITRKNGRPRNEWVIGDQFVTFQQLLKTNIKIIDL